MDIQTEIRYIRNRSMA